MIKCSKSASLSRRESRRQDRREVILAVASKSFFEHGYAGTSMSAVAAALGGSKGTLWNYFPCKEELFTAVIDQRTAVYRDQLSELLDPCGDLRETLRRFCKGFMERVTSPEAIALHRLVIAEAGRFPELGRIFYHRALMLIRADLGDFLAGAMARGRLRHDDPTAAAHQLVTLCMSGCHQRLLLGLIDHAPSEQIAADIDRSLDIFLSAYLLPVAERPQ